jgi:hypothetical protein
VPVEHERAPEPIGHAGRPGDELGAALEAETGWDHAAALDVGGVRLPEVHLEAGGRQALGEVRLERGLLPRRRAEPAAGPVVPDECGQQVDQLVAAAGDLGDHPLLQLAHG